MVPPELGVPPVLGFGAPPLPIIPPGDSLEQPKSQSNSAQGAAWRNE
jgi:hypothetical protein